jgi:hypothetical protein
VAASATAILNDINLSVSLPVPRRGRQISRKPCKHRFAHAFLTAWINQEVPTLAFGLISTAVRKKMLQTK